MPSAVSRRRRRPESHPRSASSITREAGSPASEAWSAAWARSSRWPCVGEPDATRAVEQLSRALERLRSQPVDDRRRDREAGLELVAELERIRSAPLGGGELGEPMVIDDRRALVAALVPSAWACWRASWARR